MKKRNDPLFQAPQPMSLETVEDAQAWIAVAGMDGLTERERLEAFVAHVLEARAEGDRVPLLEEAQRHMRYVHFHLRNAPNAVVNLVAQAMRASQWWQRLYVDATVRDLVRIGEASKCNEGGRPKGHYPELEKFARELLDRGVHPRNISGICEKKSVDLTGREQGMTTAAIRNHLRSIGILAEKEK